MFPFHTPLKTPESVNICYKVGHTFWSRLNYPKKLGTYNLLKSPKNRFQYVIRWAICYHLYNLNVKKWKTPIEECYFVGFFTF